MAPHVRTSARDVLSLERMLDISRKYAKRLNAGIATEAIACGVDERGLSQIEELAAERRIDAVLFFSSIPDNIGGSN